MNKATIQQRQHLQFCALPQMSNTPIKNTQWKAITLLYIIIYLVVLWCLQWNRICDMELKQHLW